ncbi:MAG: cytochrome c oxidase assembly protein [Candidatus Limnocylindrales bacterium]
MPLFVRRGTVGAAAAASWSTLLLAVSSPVSAHGAPAAPVDAWTALTTWSLEVPVVLPLVLAAVLYHWAVRAVDRAHPASRVPRRRVWAWDAGLIVLLVALESPVGTYDTTLFSAHMLQHLLLMMVAAPLLALGAPITLLLRVVRPEARQRLILPFLRSRPMRALTFPVVAWVLFAGVLYVSHFSSLFDAALENDAVHVLEHALYLSAALLFWWPVVGADPSPWRLPHPMRVFYLLIGMPWSSFLGLAILSAPSVLYAHYATLSRPWGPTPLADQQLAGGLMWAVGDGLFLGAMVLAIAAWLRSEEAEGRRLDAQLDRQTAAREGASE